MPEILRVPLKVLLHWEDGIWFAHCLEFDLLGDGPTRQSALDDLATCIGIQLEASLEYDDPAILFHPAPGEYFHKFSKGRDVADCALTLHAPVPKGAVSLDKTELREYSDDCPTSGDLVVA